jgi:hypothetical protein
MVNSNKNVNSTISITKKRHHSIKKRQVRKHESTKDRDKTFYNKINRMKTIKKRKENIVEEKHEKEQKNTKMNYGKLISQNIEKNQQNLNNPEEYFEGFFNDIIFNKKKSNKIKPEIKIKKRSTLDK